MLALENVTFNYEDMHMRFTLAVQNSSFMAITGPSGAGKSTLLSLIAGFEQPLSGMITINGVDMAGLTPSERPLSMMFQDNNVFAHLNVWTNVALGLSPRLALTAAMKGEVDWALDRVGVAELAGRKPTEVSGGERQRIAIARSLVRHQPLLLLDEPFTALGPALREEMLQLLLDLKAERDLTLMMVTHQPQDLRAVADNFAFIAGGEVRHILPSAKFFSRSAPPEISAYLG